MWIFLFILPGSEALSTVDTDSIPLLPLLHIDVAPVPLRIDTLAPSSLECRNDK
jgi:hypothetical protein